MRATVFVIVLIAILALAVDAYKSVRHMRPETEEERQEHHLFHRRRPEKEIGHDAPVAHHEGGAEPHWHRSKSYHRQYGPRYGGFNEREEADRPAPRFDYQGHRIPDFVHHDDNPDMDRSRIIL